MEQKKNRRIHSLRAKLLRVVGLAAGAALVVMGIALGGGHLAAGTPVAGSGDAPTNTVYTQPAIPGASMGATATETTPGSTLATASASPALKGGG